MINAFVLKKYGALIMNGMLSTILFFVGLTYYGLLGGLGFMFCGLLLGVLLATIMLKNPFQMMLEGKGILALNIDSTGIIRPFIVSVDPPYIRGKLGKFEMNDVFDRSAIFQIAKPVKNATHAKAQTDGGIEINGRKE